MNPQGTGPINLAQFTHMTAAINGARSCAELEALVIQAFGSLGAVKSAITSELAAVEPILALLTPPGANLSEIVTYIEKLITAFITPLAKPAVTYASQITALTVQIAALTAAISSAQAKFHSCSITVPSL
jgi:hypothetical protein